SYSLLYLSFFFTVPATPQFYSLSLHDALPICLAFFSPRRRLLENYGLNHGGQRPRSAFHFSGAACDGGRSGEMKSTPRTLPTMIDRKSTRLNSSHVEISYAVFCLKKKKKKIKQ